jgi:3-oxoacyl-[acyl-carrier-protein] synthase II
MKRRIAITGMGVICSGGADCTAFSATVTQGKASFAPITDPRLTACTARFAGIMPDFDVRNHLPDPLLTRCDRFVQLAAVAARQAVAESGLHPATLGPGCGLFLATCSGPMLSIEAHYAKILASNPAISAEELFAKRYYSAAKILSHYLSVGGLSTTITTACSASTGAVGIAADCIAQGLLTAAVVGGADAFSPTTMAGFDGLKATNDSTCAPFSKPIGLTLGEGAAFVVLEDFEHAQSRHVPIIAELLGYGLSNDASHCSAPDASGRGQGLAMERALADAGLRPDQIGYINAHGTGTEANDKAETKAVVRVFGEHSQKIGMSSTKSMVGHCLGAAGTVELIASLLAARAGVFPPTASHQGNRESCTLDYIPDVGRRWAAQGPFMTNNFAFGGNNASLVVHSQPRHEEVTVQIPDQPVFITGAGILSSAGLGVTALTEALAQATRTATPAKLADGTSVDVCMVPPLKEREIDRRLDLRGMDAASRFATIAAKSALVSAGFAERPQALTTLGFYLCLSAGPSWAEGEHIPALLADNFKISQVMAFPYIVPNSVAGNVCRTLRLQGHNSVICGGPTSGNLGLGLAACALRAGHCGSMLCGAVDELSPRIIADSWSAQPWGHDGRLPPGEGAAVFLLETESAALARQARPLARITAMAFSAETSDWRVADSDSALLQATISNALESAEIGAAEIGKICLDSADGRVQAALSNLGLWHPEKLIDAAAVTGVAQASLPLFSLSSAIHQPAVDSPEGANYILSAFSSPHGNNSVLILKV